ncbi:MAG TPA: hypothetical protein VFX02_11080 [Gammaproteobacteria bacterium]|nr:hypothetical protein [Gammaproteobacteria bacterium]
MNQNLNYFFIAATVSIVIGLLASAAGKAKPKINVNGMYVLEYPKLIKGFAVGISVFCIGGLVLLALFVPIKDDGDKWAMIFLFLFAFLFAVYFYIEFFTVKILVGPTGIEGTSGWRGKRKYSWSDIEKITYSPVTMWFKITAHDKTPLRIHAWIGGLQQFQKCFIENLPEEKWLSAHEKFMKDGRVVKG